MSQTMNPPAAKKAVRVKSFPTLKLAGLHQKAIQLMNARHLLQQALHRGRAAQEALLDELGLGREPPAGGERLQPALDAARFSAVA